MRGEDGNQCVVLPVPTDERQPTFYLLPELLQSFCSPVGFLPLLSYLLLRMTLGLISKERSTLVGDILVTVTWHGSLSILGFPSIHSGCCVPPRFAVSTPADGIVSVLASPISSFPLPFKTQFKPLFNLGNPRTLLGRINFPLTTVLVALSFIPREVVPGSRDYSNFGDSYLWFQCINSFSIEIESHVSHGVFR